MGCCSSSLPPPTSSTKSSPPPPTLPAYPPMLSSPSLLSSALLEAAQEASLARADDATDEDEWEDQQGPELDALLAPAEGGGEDDCPARLIDARFLVSLAQKGGRIERRQDLPPEAFLSFEQVKALPGSFGYKTLRVVCVSYPWLQPDHPDPKSFQLRILAHALSLFVEYEVFGKATLAVFLDFCSLHQPDAQVLASETLGFVLLPPSEQLRLPSAARG